MNYELLNLTAAGVLFCLSLWCIFSSSYNDGLVGKIIFIMLALSCYSVFANFPDRPSLATKTVLLCSLAGAAFREFFVRKIQPVLNWKIIKGFFHE